MISEKRHRRPGRFPFRLLYAQEIVTPGPQRYARENYPVLTMEYVTSGAGFLEIDGRSFHVTKDSVYFLTPGSTHAYWPDKNDPWSKIFFVAYGDLVDALLRAYALEKVYCIPDAPELKKYFKEMLYLKRSPRDDGRAAVAFHRLLNEISGHISRKSRSGIPEHLEDLRKQLDGSLETHFSLAQYARAHNCTGSALIRSFRRLFGTTPHEYLMENRMFEAEKYLLYTELSIKEIAAALAFSDQYHFSNAFKKRRGCSPSLFRRRSLSKPEIRG